MAKIAESNILIINGAGIKERLEDIIAGANEKIIIVECSKGLKNRKENVPEEKPGSNDSNHEEVTENEEENQLDKWITEAVKKIPEGKRLLVTNHKSFGYYADRYEFKVQGTVIPSSSSTSSPSAKEISELIEKIKATGAKAIFLETGSDPKIANQIAMKTNIKIVTQLYTHSLKRLLGFYPLKEEKYLFTDDLCAFFLIVLHLFLKEKRSIEYSL